MNDPFIESRLPRILIHHFDGPRGLWYPRLRLFLLQLPQFFIQRESVSSEFYKIIIIICKTLSASTSRPREEIVLLQETIE